VKTICFLRYFMGLVYDAVGRYHAFYVS
jgi:hypothetical protein